MTACIPTAARRSTSFDKRTGEVLARGKIDHKSSFAINSPTYAEGTNSFVGLANGCVQAFDPEVTLESLWLYEDPLGGQLELPHHL